MDDKELYRVVKEEQEKEKATGINKLMVDIEDTGHKTASGVKEALDMGVDNVDKDVSYGVKKSERDIEATAGNIKNELKQDIGVGNAKSNNTDNVPSKSRFDKAVEGEDLKVKEPEPEKDEVYMSRKMRRRMGE